MGIELMEKWHKLLALESARKQVEQQQEQNNQANKDNLNSNINIISMMMVTCNETPARTEDTMHRSNEGNQHCWKPLLSNEYITHCSYE
jgi:hypothetical protein